MKALLLDVHVAVLVVLVVVLATKKCDHRVGEGTTTCTYDLFATSLPLRSKSGRTDIYPKCTHFLSVVFRAYLAYFCAHYAAAYSLRTSLMIHN